MNKAITCHKESLSFVRSQPSTTATTGLMYVCMLTIAGGLTVISQVKATKATSEPIVIRYTRLSHAATGMPVKEK